MPRLVARILLAALFLFAGAVHLIRPRLFLPIMPPWIPTPMAGILVSGIAELLGGVALLIPMPAVQTAAGWELLLLLVAVFPANIHMATAHAAIPGLPIKDWMRWARLPLQPVIMLIVSWSTGIWPKS